MRTGARAKLLADLLTAGGLIPTPVTPARPTPQRLGDELLELYRCLGGCQASPALRPGAWDLVFEGPIVVELDEELHFNRYRAMTLRASWAQALPWREDYLRYCDKHESDCLAAGRWGKRWTNDSCARMFTGGPLGKLDGAGAPRWKQRALYDAIKDSATMAETPVAMARLSIYDVVAGHTLGQALSQAGSGSADEVAELLRRRTVAPV
ncbi:MAG: hypothetical protein ABSC56_04975 [Solirubrobacteraceae bacterium]